MADQVTNHTSIAASRQRNAACECCMSDKIALSWVKKPTASPPLVYGSGGKRFTVASAAVHCRINSVAFSMSIEDVGPNIAPLVKV